VVSQEGWVVGGGRDSQNIEKNTCASAKKIFCTWYCLSAEEQKFCECSYIAKFSVQINGNDVEHLCTSLERREGMQDESAQSFEPNLISREFRMI